MVQFYNKCRLKKDIRLPAPQGTGALPTLYNKLPIMHYLKALMEFKLSKNKETSIKTRSTIIYTLTFVCLDILCSNQYLECYILTVVVV